MREKSQRLSFKKVLNFSVLWDKQKISKSFLYTREVFAAHAMDMQVEEKEKQQFW